MAKKQTFRDFVISAMKAYSHCARVEINGDYLIIKNTYNPKTLHPFVNGREKLTMTDKQKKIAKELIKNHYN